MDITIGELVHRFDTGEIRLPIMQRDYVWKPKKVVSLLDSLYRGWPIGSFYVWQTQDDHPAKKRTGSTIPQRRLDGFYGFLLDGQQRLTSLSLAIRGEADGALPERAFFDLANEHFYLGHMTKTVRKRIEASDALLVPLCDIVSSSRDNDAAVIRSIERITQNLRDHRKLGKGARDEQTYRERLHNLASLFKRKALCEEFPDEDEEHAFELFSRLNKGGTTLSAGDVEAARLASAATKGIVEPMRAMAAERDMRALGINFIFLLRCLVTTQRGNCSFSKLPRNWADDTREVEVSWRRTERAVRAVVGFVRTQIGWTTRRWLPSTNALIPIIYLLTQDEKFALKGKDADYVKSYLLISGLRSLFQGAAETTVNFYVNSVRNARGDFSRHCRALFERIPHNRKYKIRKDDVRKASGLYSSLMQVYLAYLFAKEARSWPSGRVIRDILRDALPSDPLSVHHIFPKKFMQDRDVPVDRLNNAANYAILSQADNSELAERDPLDVWRGFKQNQKQHASFQLCFVAKDDWLKPEAHEDFFDYRAEKIADQLNEFMNLGVT